MASKKKEVILQTTLVNQEQWEEMLKNQGLTVVDVYQQWCGPCRSVVSLLRKLKNELGDDLLHLATAEADSIDALESYRGRCEPTFLFYGGGELVGVLRGANGPLLQKMLVEELAQERMVLEEKAERRVVIDERLKEGDEHEFKDEPAEDILGSSNKSYTVAVLKPDVVESGKAEEIISKIQEAGFDIVVQEPRHLSSMEAAALYQHKQSEEGFDELQQFMSGGLSHMLVLSGDDTVTAAWRELMGPADVEQAKAENPDCLRATYGTDLLHNAVHGSANEEEAQKEIALLFPSLSAMLTQSDSDEDNPDEVDKKASLPTLSQTTETVPSVTPSEPPA